jgi:hypothetical protein
VSNPDDPADLQVDPTAFVSPLKLLVTEVHEVALVLESVGMPERMLTQVIAHMLADAILYRDEYVEEDDSDDEDEYSDDEDDVENDGIE